MSPAGSMLILFVTLLSLCHVTKHVSAERENQERIELLLQLLSKLTDIEGEESHIADLPKLPEHQPAPPLIADDVKVEENIEEQEERALEFLSARRLEQFVRRHPKEVLHAAVQHHHQQQQQQQEETFPVYPKKGKGKHKNKSKGKSKSKSKSKSSSHEIAEEHITTGGQEQETQTTLPSTEKKTTISMSTHKNTAIPTIMKKTTQETTTRIPTTVHPSTEETTEKTLSTEPTTPSVTTANAVDQTTEEVKTEKITTVGKEPTTQKLTTHKEPTTQGLTTQKETQPPTTQTTTVEEKVEPTKPAEDERHAILKELDKFLDIVWGFLQ